MVWKCAVPNVESICVYIAPLNEAALRTISISNINISPFLHELSTAAAIKIPSFIDEVTVTSLEICVKYENIGVLGFSREVVYIIYIFNWLFLSLYPMWGTLTNNYIYQIKSLSIYVYSIGSVSNELYIYDL